MRNLIGGLIIVAIVLPIAGQQPKNTTLTNGGSVDPRLRPGGPTVATERGSAQRIDVVVSDSRPLAALATKLELKYGVPVSYEDVMWVSPDDVIPVGQISNPANKLLKDLDMLVPALGTIEFGIDIDSKSGVPLTPITEALQSAFGDHFRRNNPGEFRAEELGDEEGFSIIPSRSKNSKGVLVDSSSPLAVRISLPESERTGAQSISAILEAVTAATGSRFSILSNVPLAHSSFGAKNEVARDVLARVLRTSYDWKASWRLYYGPSEGYWGVNIHAVYRETGKTSPEGKPEVAAVRWPGRPYVLPSTVNTK